MSLFVEAFGGGGGFLPVNLSGIIPMPEPHWCLLIGFYSEAATVLVVD